MAEILITGMEMPKDGFTRIMVWPDGGVAIEVSPNNYEQLDDNAIEVPPHGELIDRKKLLEHRFEMYNSNEEVCEDYVETYHVLEAPIVIEASKERE